MAAVHKSILIRKEAISGLLGNIVATYPKSNKNGKDAKERADFINQTMNESCHLFATKGCAIECQRDALQLVVAVSDQFAQIERVLTGIEHGSTWFSQSFDALEMGLKRRLYEYEFFCNPKPMDAWEPVVKNLWIMYFGTEIFVPWGLFLSKCAIFIDGSTYDRQTYNRHLRAFMCFPGRSTTIGLYVTQAALELFLKLYGPFGSAWDNFGRLMCGHGFVGMVNAVYAKTMFDQVSTFIHTKTVLIRYSRSHPDLFAVTVYDPKKNSTYHARNTDVDGNSIPIIEFIRQLEANGMEIAQFSLGEDAITPSTHTMAITNCYTVKNLYNSK